MVRRLLSLLAAFILLTSTFMVPGQAQAPQAMKFSHMFFGTFDTAITILGFARDKASFDEAASLAERMFLDLHKQFNQYYPYEGLNNLYYLNQHAGKAPVQVPDALFQLLQWAKETQPLVDGKVNIALGSVLRLWHDVREEAEANPENINLPSMEALQAAKLHTDMDDVILDEIKNTVFYADPSLRLDVGAVAKGYATELVAQALLQSDMSHFIINAGGNVRTGLAPLDGRENWSVGIQDPQAQMVIPGNNDVVAVVQLHNASLVTSGDYQRFFIKDGVRYHHIIDPLTLMPAAHMRAVTIITEDSGLADLLSTAVFLMPYEEGRLFVDSLEGVEAIWILNDLSIRMSAGAEAITRLSKSTEGN